MAALTAKRKDEIAKELRVAATWVGGPRQVKLLALAEELGGLDAEEAVTKATERAAQLSAGTAKVEDKAEAKSSK